MNDSTIHLLPGPSPPQLLLAQFCSVSLLPSNLDPQLLSLRATKVTDLLREILNHNSWQRPPLGRPAPVRKDRQDNSADKGHRYGGIND